ncbi:MAG TPA: hypothetical protein VFI25_14035 [Planctomycetota bacterium]|jgi:hypothetical protein|nr:hypothetical protein [Planctomycetota bacterium]
MLVVDPWHWLAEDGSLPVAPRILRTQTIRVARLIECGGPLRPGEARETLVECPRRPGGRACEGLLVVAKRRDETLFAACPACCNEQVVIHNWQGTRWARGPASPLAGIEPIAPRDRIAPDGKVDARSGDRRAAVPSRTGISEERKLSAIFKDLASAMLKAPEGALSSEAMHAALLFANAGWNRSLGHPPGSLDRLLADFEKSRPRLWDELRSRDPEELIGLAEREKRRLYSNDRRVALVCGMRRGKVHVEWCYEENYAAAARRVEARILDGGLFRERRRAGGSLRGDGRSWESRGERPSGNRGDCS